MENPWNSVSSPLRTIFTELLTKPYLAWGGGQVDPTVVFFNNWKSILSRQLKFSGCLNPYFAYTRLNPYFAYTRLNLHLNLLSVIGFLTLYCSLESLYQKQADCTTFAKNVALIFLILHIFICWVFSKMYNLLQFAQFFAFFAF